MSPLFGKKKDKKKEQAQAHEATMQSEVDRLGSLPTAQLAGEVMTKSFGPSGPSVDGVLSAAMLVDAFAPDSVTAQPTRLLSPPRGHEQDSYWRLTALVREGVQVLEQAGLVLYSSKPPGHGEYSISRLGRDALENDAVDRVIERGSL